MTSKTEHVDPRYLNYIRYGTLKLPPDFRHPDIVTRYLARLGEIRYKTARICCIVALLVVTFGVLFDLVAYPGYFPEFILTRAVALSVVVIAYIALLRTSQNHFPSVPISIVSIHLTVSSMVGVMIYLADGAQSSYSIAFTLHMIGISLIGGVSFKESMLYVITTILVYIIAIWAKGLEDKEINRFIEQMMFLVASGVLCGYNAYLSNLSTMENFILGQKLEENWRALKAEKDKKETFIANISHELRTPLTLVLHLIKAIIDHPSDASKVVELSVKAHDSAIRLLNEINKLLNLTYDSLIDIPTTEINLNQLLVNYLAMIEEHLARNGHPLEYHIDRHECAYIEGNINLLETALTHLVSNAQKFSPPGTTIHVRGAIDPGSSVYNLEIEDHGRGIPAAHLDRVFERFYQVDSSSTKESTGMGIGLSAAQGIVQRHKGRIKLDSREGEGTTVTIKLPIVRTTISDQPLQVTPIKDLDDIDASAAIYELSRPTVPQLDIASNAPLSSDSHHPERIEDCVILVCEDNPQVATLTIRHWLHRFRNVHCATDGEQALQKIQTIKPNIVLLDLQMPKLSGLDVLKRVDRTAIPFTRFILFTATPARQNLEPAFNAGAHDYIEKGSLADTGDIQLRVRIRSNAETSMAIQQRDKALNEIHKAHEKITQLEKLRVVETIASGLLHEINNPLSIARELTCLTLDEATPAQRKDLERAVQHLDRIGRLIDRLRKFSRSDGVGSIEPLDLTAVVTRAIADAYLPPHIPVAVEMPDHLAIESSENALNQILQTLLRNAAQAMHDTAHPAIRIALPEHNPRHDHLAITVTDTGPGIPAYAIQRIFDPFFTTRDVNEGTGLGLYVAQSLAIKLGGLITARNLDGGGAQFILSIPVR